MSLLKLDKEHIKHITFEESISKEKYFIFYKWYIFCSAVWFDSEESYNKNLMRIKEDEKLPLETIYFNEPYELFNHKKIIFYKNENFIRFYTIGNDLYVDCIHNQCIDNIASNKIGYSSKYGIELINKQISLDIIKKKQT